MFPPDMSVSGYLSSKIRELAAQYPDAAARRAALIDELRKEDTSGELRRACIPSAVGRCCSKKRTGTASWGRWRHWTS